MAAIYLRKDIVLNTVRVRFRRKGIPEFSISFDNWEDACEWVKENEDEYYENPGKYFKWRDDLYHSMRVEKSNLKDGIYNFNRVRNKNKNG